MKIDIDIDEKYNELSVQIKAPKLTSDIERMISIMRMIDMQLAVKKGDEIVLVETNQILYFETVERNTFVYTKENIYEVDLRLYEVEQQLIDQGFIRISKTCILNLKKIQSLKADINRKIKVTLINGEQIIVSRNYADELRRRLGVR
ncbi:MAG: LytTR family transcriptional regulator DNA-binding domain-containing protein [Lachnospiraceae bacterium]|nr:LytTR family transcriptional regulator DNA-binding domain-containing protein [Lachnospiraceae bacterium]